MLEIVAVSGDEVGKRRECMTIMVKIKTGNEKHIRLHLRDDLGREPDIGVLVFQDVPQQDAGPVTRQFDIECRNSDRVGREGRRKRDRKN